jgi:DNA-binding transcriptional LysR family regulator
MDMNIQKYMAFMKAVDLQSFSKAADALHYSQSGISRMINDLETEWGVTLLERNRSGVRLTSDGLMLLPQARSLVAEYRKLQTLVGALKGVESGIIRIGTFSSVATHWLPNIIRRFQKDYPNIEYELLLGDYREIEQWVLGGRVDCGFLSLPVHPELQTIFLEEDKLMAVLPEAHPLAGHPFFPVSALGEYPFMLLKRGEAKSEVADFLAQWGVSVNVRFTTWDDYAILAMVECGLGISILPQLILRRIPYKVLVKPMEKPAWRNICLAVRDTTNTSPAVLRFLDYLPYRTMQEA